jgi:hypothetical protein
VTAALRWSHGAAAARIAESIAATQHADGAIPWFPGGHTDPWDHVEAAMGLDAAHRPREARAAYRWLRATQNHDGSWFRRYQGAEVADPARESNFCAYLAVGLHYHVLRTGDDAFLAEMWPALDAAITFVLGLQAPGGQISWAVDAAGRVADEALLTGCSSMYQSLRCAVVLAERAGRPRPEWAAAARRLHHALVAHPERFALRERYSMDWYYPVLAGVLHGQAAARRIADGWRRFVVPGLGVRCVADRPWVTGAETCELVLALCRTGAYGPARRLLAAVQRLQHSDGSYWTGYVYPDDAIWPEERPTWTAGAVLLATAAVHGDPVTAQVFGGSAGAETPVQCRDVDVCAA